MKIAITGHRPNKLGNDYDGTSELIKSIKSEICIQMYKHTSRYPDMFIEGITGMALGIDQLFADICIKANIPFIAAIPCIGQWSKWPQKSIKLYDEILANPLCTKYLVSDSVYFDGCMDKRNIWMVDQLTEPEDRLIAVWDGSKGGTCNCHNYAKHAIGQDKIIRINPKLL